MKWQYQRRDNEIIAVQRRYITNISTIFHSPPVGILFQPSHSVPPQKKIEEEPKDQVTWMSGRTDSGGDSASHA